MTIMIKKPRYLYPPLLIPVFDFQRQFVWEQISFESCPPALTPWENSNSFGRAAASSQSQYAKISQKFSTSVLFPDRDFLYIFWSFVPFFKTAAKSCLGWKMVQENLEQCLWCSFFAHISCVKQDLFSGFWKAVLLYEKKKYFHCILDLSVASNLNESATPAALSNCLLESSIG